MSNSTLLDGLNAFQFLTRNLDDRFQRQALWSPRNLMVALLLLTYPGHKMSYRSTLSLIERFGGRLLHWSRVPTLGSMSKARAKLTADACRSYLRSFADSCTQILAKPRHVWRGRRIIAIDGMRLVVPRSKDTLPHFHCPSGGNGTHAHHPRALSVVMIDLLRRLPLDWVVGRKGQGERTLIKDLLDHVRPEDVVVIDRGFPSRALLAALVERQVDVVMRVSASKTHAWREFQPFLTGKKKNAHITLELGASKQKVTIKARLVERSAQPGRPRAGTRKERMVILTTLKEEDGFTREEIVKLYAARWGIETAFRELKSFLDSEKLHTKTAQGVDQEIAAGLIWAALATLMENTAMQGLADGKRVIRSDCYRFAGIILTDYLTGKPNEEEFTRLVGELQKYAYTPKQGRYAERKCNVPYGRSHVQFG